MPMNILFDSDVLIAYLRGNEKVAQEIENLAASNALLAITPITEAEIRRGLRSHERGKTQKALDGFHCLELNRKVGQVAGDYLRRYAATHGVETPDALIAAASYVYRFELCTFNWKHFPMTDIKRHHLI